MKTIAISIDEESLAAIDRMASPAARGGRRKKANRSELIRRALRDFVAQQRRREREASDARVLAAHRTRLERQVAALVAEQARP